MGEAILQIREHLNEYWQSKDKSTKKRIIIVAVILLILASLSIILTRPKYEILYQNLSLKDVAQITKKLDEMGIKWTTPKHETTTIRVPSKLKNKIKIELASYGLPKEGYSFMDALKDSSWTMTDYDKKESWKLAKQSELSTTISEIDGIEEATVYINEKESSAFILEQNNEETTASVFIEKSDNRPLKGETVNAIQNLVAGSINMDPKKVQIIDSEGRLLSGNEDGIELLMTDQFIIKNNLELKINDSVKRFLENIFGIGNVDVRSSVKINFDSEKTTILEFNPPIEGEDEGLVRSMEEIEEHMVGGGSSGVPGETSNPQDPDYLMEDDQGERHDRRSSTINYELDEINKEIRRAPGQVEDITIAVLINKDVLIDEGFTKEESKEIEDLIFAATGLDTKKVTVRADSFRTDIIVEQRDKTVAIGLLPIIALIFLIALLGGYILYRKRKIAKYRLEQQVEESGSMGDEMEDLEFDSEESRMKVQIERFVEKSPESVAQLLKTWLNE